MDAAITDLHYLQRCVDIAQLADAGVSPNPRVGAVLVHQGRIIGEGYHRGYGQAHAEVNCVASVRAADQGLISAATLYVSLEPCCIYGRTPPCTKLIVEKQIKKVVISQLDKTATVHGKGVDILRAAGVEVRIYPDFEPAKRLVAPRQVYASSERPYILLKFAQSADGFLAPGHQEPYWITQPISRRTVHYWRSRTAAILVGANTILRDNPALTTRLYPGPSPQIIVLDPNNRIQHSRYRIFQEASNKKPLLLQTQVYDFGQQAETFLLDARDWTVASEAAGDTQRQWIPILRELHQRQLNHLTVEGGAKTLSNFLEAGLWDEARVFTGTTTYFHQGLVAPKLSHAPQQQEMLGVDRLEVYFKP